MILLPMLGMLALGIAIGAVAVLWWVKRDEENADPQRVYVGRFKDVDIWAEKDGLWWLLWMERGEGYRARLYDPFHIGNPGRWISLGDAIEIARRVGTVEVTK